MLGDFAGLARLRQPASYTRLFSSRLQVGLRRSHASSPLGRPSCMRSVQVAAFVLAVAVIASGTVLATPPLLLPGAPAALTIAADAAVGAGTPAHTGSLRRYIMHPITTHIQSEQMPGHNGGTNAAEVNLFHGMHSQNPAASVVPQVYDNVHIGRTVSTLVPQREYSVLPVCG
jgi:hypothetical protein